jgi:hypothetical protein
MIRNGLPGTLKTLVVFEDFDENLAAALSSHNPQLAAPAQVDTARLVDTRIGMAFASRSLDLEQLSVSYMVNAEDFFQACAPTWTWQHLQSLALTSQMLRDAGLRSRQGIDSLLRSAGVAALQMPALRALTLRNGARGNACSFIYQTDCHGGPQIVWRGTWILQFSHDVVKAWQDVE